MTGAQDRDLSSFFVGVAFAGISLVSFFYGLIGVTALAVIYWYRDCDPVLSGVITRYDQIVPYYIHKNTKTLDGVRGLFLAGVVSASISTISSVVNSHAAVLFVDIVLPNFRVPERKSALLIACLGAGSGTIMTLASLVLPYVSSAAKVSAHRGADFHYSGAVVSVGSSGSDTLATS
ncbi:hypothetical protein V5799_015656 [Amblyomma americanum]|uniref:Uncharacterized protein n=1 Tax=Amblyomma americanum TaxID=6943 RepID=A0AAQ4F769_AMBAM